MNAGRDVDVAQLGLVDYVDQPPCAAGILENLSVDLRVIGRRDHKEIPFRLSVTNAFPSPSTDATVITYTVPAVGLVRVSIHDPAGRTVALLRHEPVAAGRHTDTWDGRADGGAPVAPGVYLVRVEQDGAVAARRMVRLR